MHQLVTSCARPVAVKTSKGRSQAGQATSAPPSMHATTQRRHDGALRVPRRSMNLSKAEVELDEAEQSKEPFQVNTAAPIKKQQAQVRRTSQRRRESSSRGARRSINEDIDELVQTSALVPTCEAMQKQSFDSESVCTTAPPSAESSPALTVMADAPLWPSLREACSGFDFLSNCADEEDMAFLWEDLPEPALAMEELAQPETTTSKVKLSYADSICRPSASPVHMLPPASGTRTLPPFQLRSQGHKEPLPASATGVTAGDDEDFDFQSAHGWTKEHKASHSKKQQRKVAGQKERRASQRNQGRGGQGNED